MDAVQSLTSQLQEAKLGQIHERITETSMGAASPDQELAAEVDGLRVPARYRGLPLGVVEFI